MVRAVQVDAQPSMLRMCKAVLLMAALMAIATACARSTTLACMPPEPVLTKLRTWFVYLNRIAWKEEGRVEHFSMAQAGSRVFIRHNNDPFYQPGIHPVDIYEGAEDSGWIGCADDVSWINCVVDGQENVRKKFPTNNKAIGPPCDFDLPLPEWKPSPDDEQKKQVAADISAELKFVWKTPDVKGIYVRDFNLSDLGLDILIVYMDGHTEVQGCGLDSTQSPHCTWHLYGQGSLDSTIPHIMEKPYRLYPPPIGKP